MNDAAYLAEIDRDGFAIIQSQLTQTAMEQLLERVNRLKPHRRRAGIRHALQLDPVVGIARSHEMMTVACAVLGNAAFPFRATLFDKSQASNWLVVWHQDTGLPIKARKDAEGWAAWSTKDGVNYAHVPASVLSNILALRLHLDDSLRGNGPLRVLPGTHCNGVLDDDAMQKLAAEIAPTECVAAAGSIVAMRPLIVHGSSKSRSDAPRKVLHIEYAASPSIAHPLEFAIA